MKTRVGIIGAGAVGRMHAEARRIAVHLGAETTKVGRAAGHEVEPSTRRWSSCSTAVRWGR